MVREIQEKPFCQWILFISENIEPFQPFRIQTNEKNLRLGSLIKFSNFQECLQQLLSWLLTTFISMRVSPF